VGRHAVLELDAPTEQLAVTVLEPKADEDKPVMPVWLLTSMFGGMAVIALVGLVIMLSSLTSSHSSGSEIPAAASSPIAAEQAAKEQKYLSDMMFSVGDASFYGPQYDRTRVMAYRDAWTSAGREACQLGAQGFTDVQTASRLAHEWSNASLGQPPNYSGVYFKSIAIYAWHDLC
jgi:hypothetical protein